MDQNTTMHLLWLENNSKLFIYLSLLLILGACKWYGNEQAESVHYPDSATIEVPYSSEQPFDLMAFIAAADISEKNFTDSLPFLQRISKEIETVNPDATERVAYLNSNGRTLCKEIRNLSEMGRYEKTIVYLPDEGNKIVLYRVFVYDKPAYESGYTESLEQEIRFYIRNGKPVAIKQPDGNIQTENLPGHDIMALIVEVEGETEL